MKEDVRLGLFITLVLLAAAQKMQSTVVGDIIPAQPTTLEPPSLTRFVQMTLDRVRNHESPQAITPAESELTFRLGPTPNPES
jgi:hypothetical protein